MIKTLEISEVNDTVGGVSLGGAWYVTQQCSSTVMAGAQVGAGGIGVVASGIGVAGGAVTGNGALVVGSIVGVGASLQVANDGIDKYGDRVEQCGDAVNLVRASQMTPEERARREAANRYY